MFFWDTAVWDQCAHAGAFDCCSLQADMLRQYKTGRWVCHLEAGALRLIHIQGLQVRAPLVDQLVVVVVVLAGHLRGPVLMGLIHVNHLHSMFSKPQSCGGWGLVLMGLIYMNNLHNTFSKPQSCCGWGLVLMGLIHVNNLHNMFSKPQQCCACTE